MSFKLGMFWDMNLNSRVPGFLECMAFGVGFYKGISNAFGTEVYNPNLSEMANMIALGSVGGLSGLIVGSGIRGYIPDKVNYTLLRSIGAEDNFDFTSSEKAVELKDSTVSEALLGGTQSFCDGALNGVTANVMGNITGLLVGYLIKGK